MSPNDNFKLFREAVKGSTVNCVPYLGLWLADFTFIDDGNADTVEHGMLNYEKASMTAKR